MLEQLNFAFGAEKQAPGLRVNLGAVTLFVGPNNGGKSLALREIYQSLVQPDQPRRILQDVVVRSFPNPQAFREAFDPISMTDAKGQLRTLSIPDICDGLDMPERHLVRDFGNVRARAFYIGRALTLRLDGATRLALVNPQPAGDLQQAPSNHLQALWINPIARTELRSITAEAFGRHFVVDPTNMSQLRIGMSDRAPVDEEEEQSLSARARSFHAAATPIAELSDGVKAFTGILAAVLSTGFRILTVDEPEAFLHPPLARKLGIHMAQIASKRGATVVAATHSATFVMGCIESGVPLQIVRLTHAPGASTARLLSAATLRVFMRDPLLRSTDVVSAIFHSSAIVTEAAGDRSFYQEVNHRMSQARASAIQDSIFLNAQNKQTVRRVMGPLRSIGIPAAAILDLDILKDGGKEWTELLEAAGVPQAMHGSLQVLRKQVHDAFVATNKDMKRDGGVDLLDKEQREAANNLLDQLESYGIFIVRGGELESWLSHLSVPRNKTNWLTAVFEKMGDDPDSSGYVKPASGDVWAFVSRIAAWTGDPARRGIPS